MKTGAKVAFGLFAAAAAGTGIYFATRKPSDEEVVSKAVKEVAPGEEGKVSKMTQEEIKTVATAIKPVPGKFSPGATRGGGKPGEGRGVKAGEGRGTAGLTGTQEQAIAILKKYGII